MTDRELKHLVNVLLSMTIAVIPEHIGVLNSDDVKDISIFLEALTEIVICDIHLADSTKHIVLEKIKESYDWLEEQVEQL